MDEYKPINDILEQMKEKAEKLSAALGIEKLRMDFLAALKDGKNHTGPGIVGLTRALGQYIKNTAHEIIDELFPGDYHVNLDGRTASVYPNRLKAIRDYTIKVAYSVLGPLYRLNRKDAQQYVQEEQEAINTLENLAFSC
ncbi:MAG: hypothetical protein A2Y81_06520 [Nitrospirae bacterium RBG_13_43_8]|nr:MAG: hypothetical protein A2Y81_06520 [Nitrospirae bacterium RBG_13_43_8]